MREVSIIGIGMTPFGRHTDRSLGSLATEALDAALADAGIGAGDIDATFFSNAAAGLITGQEMIRGEVALKDAGLKGGPVINVENACASGSSAASLAWLTVASGQADVALAIGAEKLFHENKQLSFDAIESGTDREATDAEPVKGSVMMSAYAAEARDYARRYGPVDEALATIAVKNRRHAGDNPYAQYRPPITIADVAGSRVVAEPLHLLTCSPLTDGAAAAIFAAAPSSRPQRDVPVRASVVVSYQQGQPIVARAATRAYELTGWSPDAIDLFQLHDACAFAELAQLEEVGIAGEGEAVDAVLSGATALGGASPVNTDGGLMSRGHALGATGLAQIFELVTQLRGEAGNRQVANARRALAVNGGGWMGDDYAVTVATALERRTSGLSV